MTTTPTVWKSLFQLNMADAGNQEAVQVIDIGLGRFVAVWTELNGGPIGTSAGADLVGQIFDAEGDPIGAAFQVNVDYFSGDEHGASLVARPDGGFVMVYQQTLPTGTSICVQTFDVDGSPVAATPIHITLDAGADELSAPSVAMQADGSYLVTYQRDVGGTGTDTDIVGKIVSAAGVVGSEFEIFGQADNSIGPDAATLSNGNYVVVFADENSGNGGNRDPKFRIVSSDGTVIDADVISSDGDDQTDVHVAALTGGGFVAVWTEANGDGSSEGIRARIYDNEGEPITTAFTVNTATAGLQYGADVTALADGGFVVVWDDNNAGLEYGQRFDASGNPIGAQFVAGQLGAEMEPVVALLSDGRFVVGFDQFGGDPDVHATIFDPRDDVIDGTNDNDVITSRKDGATVNGHDGADTLLGQARADILNGGAGIDVMYGRAGDDVYVVDESLDQVHEGASEGIDTVVSSADFALGNHIENLVLTGTAIQGVGNNLANAVTGNAGDNVLLGLGGDDTIDGRTGADTMFGGTGNDIYIVDNASDTASENAGAGYDAVRSSVSFTLGANIEALALTGSAGANGTGNSLANVMIGNDAANVLSGLAGDDLMRGGGGNDTVYGGTGNDRIDGSAGADLMHGGVGDDTYVVESIGDRAIEVAGEGTDIVESSVSFALGANVENLTLTESGDIAGSGNVLANVMIGNVGRNKLKSKGGKDVVSGDDGNDVIRGGKGGDRLLGEDGNDAIRGNGGKDKIDGGEGKDKLWGGGGKDSFVFDSVLGSDNKDRIKDFEERRDKFWLDQDIFAGIGSKLNKGEFEVGRKAKDANDHIVYDEGTGRVYFDADGGGGAKKILFAKVDKGTSLSHKDFAMVEEFVV